MTTDASHSHSRGRRDRVSLSATPHLNAILDRHARPGEKRATTAARLIERADQVPEPADALASTQLNALEEMAGMVTYPSGYLEDLRKDWDAQQ